MASTTLSLLVIGLSRVLSTSLSFRIAGIPLYGAVFADLVLLRRMMLGTFFGKFHHALRFELTLIMAQAGDCGVVVPRLPTYRRSSIP